MTRRIVCALVLAVVLAGAASGKVQDFGDFTADVPYGWRAKKQDDGTFMLSTYDGEKGIGIFARTFDGTVEYAARETSKNLKGTKPIWDKKSGTYRFRFRLDGLEWRMAVKSFDDMNKIVFVTWAGIGIKKELEHILSSVKAKADTDANKELEDTLGAIKYR